MKFQSEKFLYKRSKFSHRPPPTWHADNVENKLLYISSYSKFLEGLGQFSFMSDTQHENTFSQKELLHFRVVTESNGCLPEV